MFNIKVRNATYIKFKTLLNSIAIQLCLFLLLLGSMILSFFPWISSQFLEESPLQVVLTDVASPQEDEFEVVTEEADAGISYASESGQYQITVYTDKGRQSLSKLRQFVYNRNLEKFINGKELTSQEILMLTNNNVEVVDQTDAMELNDSQNIFLMSIVFMYFIMATILISRIGAQVASEKGNQVTEVVLTSLTRNQLYISEILAGFFITILSFAVISVPIIGANFINIPEITSDFSFLGMGIAPWVFIHLMLSSFSLIILSIGFCSLAKQSEDANAFSTILLIPVLISYIYTIMNQSLYQGVWTFLNYIPFFSTFTILAGLITSTLTTAEMIWYVFADIVFIICEIVLVRLLYVRHISKS